MNSKIWRRKNWISMIIISSRLLTVIYRLLATFRVRCRQIIMINWFQFQFPQKWPSAPNATKLSTSLNARRPWVRIGTRAAWNARNARKFSTPANTPNMTANLTATILAMLPCLVQEVSDTEEAKATSGTRKKRRRNEY